MNNNLFAVDATDVLEKYYEELIAENPAQLLTTKVGRRRR